MFASVNANIDSSNYPESVRNSQKMPSEIFRSNGNIKKEKFEEILKLGIQITK